MHVLIGVSYDCAMIGHTQLILWSRHSDIISLLTITVWVVSNKHSLLAFFISTLSLLSFVTFARSLVFSEPLVFHINKDDSGS